MTEGKLLKTLKSKYNEIHVYRILPIKGASPNKGAPYSLRETNTAIYHQNWRSFLNNCPIFNPKPPLESS